MLNARHNTVACSLAKQDRIRVYMARSSTGSLSQVRESTVVAIMSVNQTNSRPTSDTSTCMGKVMAACYRRLRR